MTLNKHSLSAALMLTSGMAFVSPSQLSAQVDFGFDTGLHSRYVWRGITRRNAAVTQADAFAAYGFGKFAITVGGWVNMELTRADARIDEDLGYGKRFGEWNAWSELAFSSGPWLVAAGYTQYEFRGEVTAASVGNVVTDTKEFYGRVGYLCDLALTAVLWYDLDQIDGGYAEFGAAYNLPVFPLGIPVLRIGTVAGVNLGQDGPRPAYFDDSGLTHWEFYAEAQLSVGVAGVNLYALPGVHAQVNVDDATKRERRDMVQPDNDWKWWIGMTLSWHRGR
jgi:hypothetical protein